jgi:ADP-heptose:LPS heptosyltransferase
MKLDFKKALDLYLGGLFILLLRPIVILLGKILGRNHDVAPKGDITIIKLLGGGSLVIGLSALLAIKRKYPNQNLNIITTKGIAPFAQTLGVFDNIYILDDSGFVNLAKSSLSILFKLFRTDTIIDWEVYSRLTTIFALFTCARNRIGFYREDVKSRKNFSTHLVYFNLYYGSWYFYEELSKLIGCDIPTPEKTRDHFFEFIKPVTTNHSDIVKIGIGHGCSDLSTERMLSPKQWKLFAQKHLDTSKQYEIHFFGAPKDSLEANKIINELSSLENVSLIDDCGKTKLDGSVRNLNEMNEFWGIDSALLHYARLLGIPTQAFYGPTSPQSLIKPLPYLKETIHYQQVPCSPCVHVTETPPCVGNNVCIKNLFGEHLNL